MTMKMRCACVAMALALLPLAAQALQPHSDARAATSSHTHSHGHSRRSFVGSTFGGMALLGGAAWPSAAIDVSGLKVEGKSGASGGGLASQLKGLSPDGSAPINLETGGTTNARIKQSTDAAARADETSTAARAALRASEPRPLNDAEKLAGKVSEQARAPTYRASPTKPANRRHPPHRKATLPPAPPP